MGREENAHTHTHACCDRHLAPHFSINKVCKRTGAVVEVIPSDESGELDVAALEEMLSRGGVKAVAVTHVPTNGGVVNPAREGADEIVSHGLERGTARFCERRPLYRTSQKLRHLRPHHAYPLLCQGR